MQEYQTNILLAIVYAANVCAVTRKQAVCFTGINKHTMHATRHSIPTFLIVTDEPKNAKLTKNVYLELLHPQVHFLILAAAWWTIQILECNKQGFIPPRHHLGITPAEPRKTWIWKSHNRVVNTLKRIYMILRVCRSSY